jgi:hypothetical protein
MRHLSPALVTAAVLAAALPAGAQAAAPVVQTGGAARVTQTSATLLGTVDPGREQTVYLFEFGPEGSTVATSRTPEVPAGAGDRPVNAAVDIAPLAPATTYRYRIVARNEDGTRRGRVRSFRTPRQPLGLTATVDANPVLFGTPAAVRGAVTGTGAGGRPVVLQGRPFPFTSEFADLTAPTPTDAAGAFAFGGLGIGTTTQFRVRLAGRPGVVGPILSVGVAARVATFVARRVQRGRRVTFRGWIRPARPGAQVAVQRRARNGEWSVVAGTITRGGSADRSRFRKRVRIRRTGRYRVLVVINDGNLVGNVGREVRIRAVRRR